MAAFIMGSMVTLFGVCLFLAGCALYSLDERVGALEARADAKEGA